MKRFAIKHGGIKNLDMPPITMVFQVKDASALDKVKVWDKLRFVCSWCGHVARIGGELGCVRAIAASWAPLSSVVPPSRLRNG